MNFKLVDDLTPDCEYVTRFQISPSDKISRRRKITERTTTEKNVLGLKHPLCGRNARDRAKL